MDERADPGAHGGSPRDDGLEFRRAVPGSVRRSALPTFVLCGEARRRIRVALSGDGGDETFGGYRRYRNNEASRAVRQLFPEAGSSALLAAAGRWAPDAKWIPKPLRLRPLLRVA